jgi:hypothetical protein
VFLCVNSDGCGHQYGTAQHTFTKGEYKILHIVKDIVKHHFIHPSHHGLFILIGRKKSGIQIRCDK